MLEIIALVLLTGVFWNYGKEMGAGRWIMVITFLGCWLGISMVIPIFFVPVIGSAVITSILGICLSVMADRERMKKVQEQIDAKARKENCTACGTPIPPAAPRCFNCGAARVAR